jgi:hypothetical protein
MEYNGMLLSSENPTKYNEHSCEFHNMLFNILLGSILSEFG